MADIMVPKRSKGNTLMRVAPLFKAIAIIPPAIAFAASAQAVSSDPFKTTDDYIRGCDVAKPIAVCVEDYAVARRNLMVKAMVGEAIKTCAPSDRIPVGTAKSYAAEVEEVRSLVAWFKEHPQPANQKYLDGLQAAMLGLSNSSYKCK